MIPANSLHARLVEGRARFRETHPPRNVQCGSMNWKYFAGGAAGECILLLHGAGGSGEGFFEYFPALESECRVVAPSVPAEVSSVDDAVAGITAVLDVECVHACHVFGHSMGGAMAIELSERIPQRVKTLMLSSTFLPSRERARKVESQLRMLRWGPDRLLGWTIKQAWKSVMRKSGSSSSREIQELVLSSMPLGGAATLRRTTLSSVQLQLDYHTDVLGPKAWNGPIIILETGRDRIITDSDRKALRERYPNAVVRRYEDAGHLDIIVDPQRFVVDIRSFLARLS